MTRFQGKSVLVTGAASGIGKATAAAFAQEGARVLLADVQEDAGRAAAAEIVAAGGHARFVRCDVTRSSDVQTMIGAAVREHGRLDIAFNNAGIEGVNARIADSPEEAFDQVLAVNLKGVWLCMKHEIPAMAAAGGGAIVNASSIAGLVGLYGAAAYVASKHGVLGLTKTAALEVAKRNIRVNAVCPGNVDTPLTARNYASHPRFEQEVVARTPLARTATPQEIARAVLYLASDEASYVTGSALSVDGGWTAQ